MISSEAEFCVVLVAKIPVVILFTVFLCNCLNASVCVFDICFMWGNILLLGTLKIKTKPFQIHFKFNKGFGKQDFDTVERPRLISLNISKVPR